MRRVPHAEDRGTTRGCECAEPYVPVRYSGRDGDAEGSECLRGVPCGQGDGLGEGGAAELEECFGMEGGELTSSLAACRWSRALAALWPARHRILALLCKMDHADI